MRNITILGSTGSIGCQALDVCRRLRLHPRYLTCGHRLALFAEQICEFKPQAVAIAEAETASLEAALRHLGLPAADMPEILTGPEGVKTLAGEKTDRVVVAISGFAALPPVYQAILAGNDLALANKECLVAAGDLIMPLARARGCHIYPVDSEHSAIWQCLAAAPHGAVSRLYLTASGGPFWGASEADLRAVTPQQALAHPVWQMGAKISLDSATMFNKGLELIEAMHLFALPEDQIEIVIHPQGIVHSLVEFKDGAILAQLGKADMRLPIQLALTWPQRVDTGLDRFTFFEGGSPRHMDFFPPDEKTFPALRLARLAARQKDGLPLVMNAANEVCAQAFLDGKILFTDIARHVEQVMLHFQEQAPLTEISLNAIMDYDSLVRAWTKKYLFENKGD